MKSDPLYRARRTLLAEARLLTEIQKLARTLTQRATEVFSYVDWPSARTFFWRLY
ncbi:hypothetical protein SAMN05443377_10381 [Propionibacterium cyclohexanicum]|uniref:Uncharacterized protein n=1 Tax=Propionibacterium cyclohexanicum TaxID=64702 RepID=A0A1H9QFK4_9ACTN|nr:hypothetical protein [Propionibacterium cyclohexanicum]SER59197.1 hypothetical protein SAMN05443377_10381 [Propionibacterium cyclohexanicum]